MSTCPGGVVVVAVGSSSVHHSTVRSDGGVLHVRGHVKHCPAQLRHGHGRVRTEVEHLGRLSEIEVLIKNILLQSRVLQFLRKHAVGHGVKWWRGP